MSSAAFTDSSNRLGENLAATRARIAAAALRYGRSSEEIELLAVSKQQSVEAIRALAQHGQHSVGESYLQEALPKIRALDGLGLLWHFIGQIQSNKTRPIAEHFHWVHTVDRLKIAERLSDQRPSQLPPLNVCIQIKLAEEEGKGGAPPPESVSLAREIAKLPRLRLRGLMCIPPPREAFDEQFTFFKAAASVLLDLQDAGVAVDTLSMGMSADLEAAVAAGATLVRVGTAIFGERKPERDP